MRLDNQISLKSPPLPYWLDPPLLSTRRCDLLQSKYFGFVLLKRSQKKDSKGPDVFGAARSSRGMPLLLQKSWTRPSLYYITARIRHFADRIDRMNELHVVNFKAVAKAHSLESCDFRNFPGILF